MKKKYLVHRRTLWDYVQAFVLSFVLRSSQVVCLYRYRVSVCVCVLLCLLLIYYTVCDDVLLTQLFTLHFLPFIRQF